MDFLVNGSFKFFVKRDEDGGHDMLDIYSQFKLNKGDTVSVSYYGTFHSPSRATFEGRLIRQIYS